MDTHAQDQSSAQFPDSISRNAAASSHPRFWWHTSANRHYEPDIYRVLSPAQRQLIIEWYAHTEKQGQVGEMAVPMASAALGFIQGSGINRIVQLGHYVGFSTLLLGWALERMGVSRGLFSFDLKQRFTDETQGWVDRAGLGEVVSLHTSDSADPACVEAAQQYFGGAPSCVIIDSSHQYAHTLAELDLWYGALEPGGLVFLHDASPTAAQYDKTGKGGVRRAIDDWLGCTERKASWDALGGEPREMTLLGPAAHGMDGAYADPSGLCILQKPFRTMPER